MPRRGSILLTTANEIGSALVNKLGGSGYAPVDWDKKINIMGIASEDIPTALDNLIPSEGGGDRGSILISKANEIGEVLNKKFQTERGFKPKEWASAISKLTPLQVKTASGAIASFPDGADDVPTRSLVVTIPATLSGVSSVTETQTGRNILKITGSAVSGDLTVTPQTDGTVIVNGQRSTALTWNAGQFVAKGTCSIVFSGCSGGSGSTYSINIQKNNVYQADVYSGDSIAYNLVQGDVINFIVVVRANVSMSNVVFSPMIRFSDVTDGTFEKYTETQYTASLGRTIYGGTADIVNGTGKDGYAKGSMTSAYLSGLSSSYIGYEASLAYFGGHAVVWVRNWNYQTSAERTAGGIGAVCNHFPISFNNADIFASQYRVYFDVDGKNITSVQDFIDYVEALEQNNDSLDIVYELATPTDFAFDGQEVQTRLGYNAFWSDEGDTEVTYRADIDLDNA